MRGSDSSEEQHAAVLRLVAHFPPTRMIAVLLPAPGVTAGGLDMSIGQGAYPDICPGRWYRQASNSCAKFGIAEWPAACVGIREVLPNSATPDPGNCVRDVTEACVPCRFFRIERRFRRGESDGGWRLSDQRDFLATKSRRAAVSPASTAWHPRLHPYRSVRRRGGRSSPDEQASRPGCAKFYY